MQKNLRKTGKDTNLDPVLLFPAQTNQVKSYPARSTKNQAVISASWLSGLKNKNFRLGVTR